MPLEKSLQDLIGELLGRIEALERSRQTPHSSGVLMLIGKGAVNVTVAASDNSGSSTIYISNLYVPGFSSGWLMGELPSAPLTVIAGIAVNDGMTTGNIVGQVGSASISSGSVVTGLLATANYAPGAGLLQLTVNIIRSDARKSADGAKTYPVQILMFADPTWTT